jgi:hypothetical protein
VNRLASLLYNERAGPIDEPAEEIFAAGAEMAREMQKGHATNLVACPWSVGGNKITAGVGVTSRNGR